MATQSNQPKNHGKYHGKPNKPTENHVSSVENITNLLSSTTLSSTTLFTSNTIHTINHVMSDNLPSPLYHPYSVNPYNPIPPYNQLRDVELLPSKILRKDGIRITVTKSAKVVDEWIETRRHLLFPIYQTTNTIIDPWNQPFTLGQKKSTPLKKPVIGLDCEWPPHYIKGKATNPVSLLQLACQSTIVEKSSPEPHFDVLIIFLDPNFVKMQKIPDNPITPSLLEMLQNPDVLKLGVNIQNDITHLADSLVRLNLIPKNHLISLEDLVHGSVDLGQVVKYELEQCKKSKSPAEWELIQEDLRLRRMFATRSKTKNAKPRKISVKEGVDANPRTGLSSLVARFLIHSNTPPPKLPKTGNVRMSNWVKWPLDESQLEYAAMDAVVAVKIWEAMIHDIPSRYNVDVKHLIHAGRRRLNGKKEKTEKILGKTWKGEWDDSRH